MWVGVFAAEYAELPLIPPYLHPGYHDHQYIYGVNFASSGAGDLPETNPGLVRFLFLIFWKMSIKEF